MGCSQGGCLLLVLIVSCVAIASAQSDPSATPSCYKGLGWGIDKCCYPSGPCNSLPPKFCPDKPGPCQTYPMCDSGNWKDYCWVDKDDGTPCKPELYGWDKCSYFTDYYCQSGKCVPKPPQGGCEAGKGGPDCKPCDEGYYSMGGTNDDCKKCSDLPQGFCKSIPGPCKKYPKCDPMTGKFESKCWVPDDAGKPCNPDTQFPGDKLPPTPGYQCKVDANGDIACKKTGPGGGCEAGKGGPDCKPCDEGYYSMGGTNDDCKKCSDLPQDFCKSIPGPCKKYPKCDPMTGKFESKCWVPDDAGKPCNPDTQFPGDKLPPTPGYQCKVDANGDIACKKTGPGGGCEAGKGGPDCKPCDEGYYSMGGTNDDCKKCSDLPQDFCKSIPGPCKKYPKCDPMTGKFESKCWVPDDAGKPCNPDTQFPGDKLPPTPGYQCKVDANGDIACKKTGPGGGCEAGKGGPDCKPCDEGYYSMGGTNDDCKKCSDLPQGFCKSIPGPCKKYPKCDPKTGKFESKCWVQDDAGKPCNPDTQFPGDKLPPTPGYQCKVDANGDIACKKTGPKCPTKPKCKRPPFCCEKAPKCINGKPVSKCWVRVPDGTVCDPTQSPWTKPANATGYVCKDRDCVIA